MQFRLTDGLSTFKYAMDIIVSTVKWQFVLEYQDYVSIFLKSVEEPLDHLQIVLGLLHRVGISLKLKKCFLSEKRIDYLGQKVQSGRLGISTNETYLICRLQHPKNVTEHNSLLRLCEVFRRFLPKFSENS